VRKSPVRRPNEGQTFPRLHHQRPLVVKLGPARVGDVVQVRHEHQVPGPFRLTTAGALGVVRLIAAAGGIVPSKEEHKWSRCNLSESKQED